MGNELIALESVPAYQSVRAWVAALELGVGIRYVAKTIQRDGWLKTWFYPWLVQNAVKYNFKQLIGEEWHWDYQ